MSIPAFKYDPPEHAFISVIYSDDDLLVLSKPSGLLSVPGKPPEHTDSLEGRTKAAFPQALLVHRLDMGTSGVMVMALNKAAQRHINLQFEKRRIYKNYHARVWGQVKEPRGHIDLPLICDWPNRPRQKICYETGKSAQTDWELIRQDEESALVRLTPLTGRSHQLRVHMLSMGHPIVGDNFYGDEHSFAASPRLALHARELVLHHPRDERRVSFTDDIDL